MSRVPVPDMCTLFSVGARGVLGAQSTLELWWRAGVTVHCTTPTRTACRLPGGILFLNVKPQKRFFWISLKMPVDSFGMWY